VDNANIDVQQGDFENSLFLTIRPEDCSRRTTFCVVYGKSGATKDVATTQWQQITHDMDRIKARFNDTDFVLLGDINARMGNPQ